MDGAERVAAGPHAAVKGRLVMATPVGNIRRVVCAGPAYLERFGAPQTSDELASHHCVTFDGLEAASAWA